MYAKRPSNPVPEFIRPQLVLTREYLNAICQTLASFHRDFEPASEVVDVDSAMPRQQRFGGKYPEMAAATGFLKCGIHAILTQLPLQLEQVFERVRVVGVNGDPLGALRLRVKRVEAHGHISIEVFTNSVQRQLSAVLRTVIIVLPVSVRLRRLHGVGQAVHEQLEIPRRRFEIRLARSVHDFTSPAITLSPGY